MMLHWKDHSGKARSGQVCAHVLPFVEIIGLDATARMLQAIGGSPINIPSSRPRAASKLSEAIGPQNARKLGERLHGGTIKMPIGNTFLCRYYRSNGMAVCAIARLVRQTDATVRRHLSDTPPQESDPARFRKQPGRQTSKGHQKC